MITIYTICYNERLMLPHFIAHYRKNLPSCKIVVFDNFSDDGSQEIAKDAGCEVRTYDTCGKLDDAKYLEIKNNCWRESETDWVIVCDVDELIQVTENDLDRESLQGVNVLLFEGYNMVNLQDDLAIETIETGVRAPSYDKLYCFNKRHINAINYSPGCHGSSPSGRLSISKTHYICKHYKYINPNYMIARHALFASRMSDNNKKRGWGVHYNYSPERIRQEFENARLNAQIVL